jgi:ADP-ribose pyrophosphatase
MERQIDGAQVEGDRNSGSARLSSPRTIGKGYRDYHRFTIALAEPPADAFDRDLLRSGDAVGILPLDIASHEVILVRQFRLGGHLAMGRGDMLEIPAGRVDVGESLEQAAYRECLEETGLKPAHLDRLFSFLPAPALSDEQMTVFLAEVDASKTLERAGVSREGEQLEVIRCGIEVALKLFECGGIHSGPTILSLQWLAIHRSSLIRKPD